MPRELTAEERNCQAPIAKGRLAVVKHFAKWLLVAWCVNLLTLPLLMIADLVNLEALLSIYYLVLLGIFFPPACFANPVVAFFLVGCFVCRHCSRRRTGNSTSLTTESVFVPW